ncbi:hypothetical protein DWU98_09480 [Dyella monticola]|uniref:Uncharacterized protein n=1 Tax=Dyella monticola TaxID=1927958 RepID=A0A370X242_9GAMM|nr:hypothetical protein DWU98_09480 [Dyella monticola]
MCDLIRALRTDGAKSAGIIPWSSPVPSFGDIQRSALATLGLNPSNREFVDAHGNELTGKHRRFHTLDSLGLRCWSKVRDNHIDMIAESCRNYFENNPYDTWFKRLDEIVAKSGPSYYSKSRTRACHLDLIPFATGEKWMALSLAQRSILLELAGNSLGNLLRGSKVRVLVLNGTSVVRGFEQLSGVKLKEIYQPSWDLRRIASQNVRGFSYEGRVKTIGNTKLPIELLILGFNHNIQSSFGVTRMVRAEISSWIAKKSGVH